MTPSELRELADEVHSDCSSRASGELKRLIDKLTDPTPISDEFAERVNRNDTVSIGHSPNEMDWRLVLHRRMNVRVATIGDVNTLLWRAGLLDQMEGE
jgi:hypothetical protein